MRWKKLTYKILRALLVLIPCAIAVLVAMLLAPENEFIYTTEGTILIQDLSDQEILGSDEEGTSASAYNISVQAKIFSGRMFLQQVALETQAILLEQARLNGDVQGYAEVMQSPDPVGFIRSKIELSTDEGDLTQTASGLLLVRFASHSSSMTRTIAEVTFNRFFRESERLRALKEKRSEEFIEENLKFYEDEYKNKQDALKQYKMQRMMDDLKVSNASVEAIEELYVQNQVQLMTMQAQLARARNQLGDLRTQADELDMDGIAVEALRDELKNLEIQRTLELRFKTELHPMICLLDKDIEVTREQLKDAYRKSLVASITNDPYNQYKQQFETVIDLESQMAVLEMQKEALESVREDLLEQLPGLEEEEMKLDRYQMEADLAGDNYEKFLSKKMVMEQAPEVEKSQIKPLKVPGEISVISNYRRTRFFIVALCIGLLIGLALASLASRFDTSVKSLRQLKNSLNLFPLGAVPHSRKLNKVFLTKMLQLYEESNLFSDSMKNIRTNLLLRISGSDAKRFLVTSSVPGEGKSTFTAALAVSFAQSGENVLMVDGDLRRPSLHTMFEQNLTPGLGELLTDGAMDWKEVIRPTALANLDLLCSGTVPLSPPELLESENLQLLLERFSRVYDVIIIDSPAVLAVSDAAMLVPGSDGVIFVAKEGGCDEESIAEASDFLKGIGAGILGCVMTFSSKKKTQYTYRYH